MTCARTQEFLAKNEVKTVEQLDARKNKLGESDALKLIGQVDEIYATKGKKVIHVNLKQARPDNAELLALLIGPTGNLRAPTIRKGRILLVGFDADTFQEKMLD